MQILFKILKRKWKMSQKCNNMEIIDKMYKIDKKDLTFVNKKEYNEYNSSGYLISAIIKM